MYSTTRNTNILSSMSYFVFQRCIQKHGIQIFCCYSSLKVFNYPSFTQNVFHIHVCLSCLTGAEALSDCPLCDPGWYCDAPGLLTPRAQCDPGFVCYEGAYTSTPTDGMTGEICPAGGFCVIGKQKPDSQNYSVCWKLRRNINVNHWDLFPFKKVDGG